MGYTHYYDTTKCITEEDRQGFDKALPLIKNILKRHAEIVCQESDVPDEPPVIEDGVIRFNGKEEDGYETFLFRFDESEFCKTSRKPYDLPVCEVLLVLNALLPSMTLSSDGFSGLLAEAESSPELDCDWMDAIENVRQYGIHYHVEITNRRNLYCDMEPILDRVELKEGT